MQIIFEVFMALNFKFVNYMQGGKGGTAGAVKESWNTDPPGKKNRFGILIYSRGVRICRESS